MANTERRDSSDLTALDPLLVPAAKRADREKPGALKEFASKGPIGLEASPLGMQSLAAQMSAPAVERLENEDLVQVIVDVENPAEVEEVVAGGGGEMHAVTASVIVAEVPRSRLAQLSQQPSVKYVEASTELRPLCDMAHVSAGLVQAGARSVSQMGSGVLIGIVDSGIDAGHPAFSTAAGTRIVDYLDQTNGGAHYTQAMINAGAAAASPDLRGHGTHVAGIAAGNGAGSPGAAFAGVAPDADIAAVKTTGQSADMVLAVAHLFDVAAERGQACVVNISMGGHSGGHDGTTVTERTIDQLSGTGRIVVIAAGNEGVDNVHAGTVLPKDQPAPASWTADFKLTAWDFEGTPVALLTVQVWSQREDNVTIRLRSPLGQFFEAPNLGDDEFDLGVFSVDASHRVSAQSGDHSSTFTIWTDPQGPWLGGWSIVVNENTVGGVKVGPVHAWILNGDTGDFTDGQTASNLVGMPGTAFSAITVASYATRDSWASADPAAPMVSANAMNLEDISYFSSPGPTRDRHNKPEISAPGQWLVSALSSATPTTVLPLILRQPGSTPYVVQQGTSMAAPYVAGAVALLLEKDPTIDWAEAKRRLIKSAKQDGFTGPCWNPRWGYGKVDVERLLTID